MELLPCFICEKKLEPAFPDGIADDAFNQPYAATAFTTHGHYGSTVFDPMDHSYLELTICDECLVKRKHLIQHIQKREPRPETVFSRRWEPGKYDE
jgi:hypothetical protein